MSSTPYEYRADQELPAIPVEWRDGDGALLDLSTGYTFTVKVAAATDSNVVLHSKTTGITGASTAPNVLIDWSTTDFAALSTTGIGTLYVAHLYARRTADSKDRVFRPSQPITFLLLPAPT